MAPGSRCTGVLSEMWPIHPIAPTFAYPNSLIWKHFENNYTLFRIFLDSVPQLPEYSAPPVKYSRSTWEHIALHSAYLGASGSIWKDQCGCSELLSCSVMTSKPFYILLMLPPEWPLPSSPPISLDHGLQVHLPTHSIVASQWISNRARIRPPWSHHHGLQVSLETRPITVSKLAPSRHLSVSPNSLNYGRQVHCIMASKSISKLAQLRSPQSLDHGLQVYLQTRSITASECISKFTQWRCGETLQLEGRQPIINTPPHLTWYPKGIRQKAWL